MLQALFSLTRVLGSLILNIVYMNMISQTIKVQKLLAGLLIIVPLL